MDLDLTLFGIQAVKALCLQILKPFFHILPWNVPTIAWVVRCELGGQLEQLSSEQPASKCGQHQREATQNVWNVLNFTSDHLKLNQKIFQHQYTIKTRRASRNTSLRFSCYFTMIETTKSMKIHWLFESFWIVKHYFWTFFLDNTSSFKMVQSPLLKE